MFEGRVTIEMKEKIELLLKDITKIEKIIYSIWVMSFLMMLIAYLLTVV